MYLPRLSQTRQYLLQPLPENHELMTKRSSVAEDKAVSSRQSSHKIVTFSPAQGVTGVTTHELQNIMSSLIFSYYIR